MEQDELSYVGDTGGDDQLSVTFYRGLHHGEETDFVRYFSPGDMSNIMDELATEQLKRRFEKHWRAYSNLQSMTGTPIRDWLDVSEGMRDEFEHLGFKFIEQVAGSPDSAFIRVMGGVSWRLKAQDFLNRGKVAEADIIKQQAGQIQELQEKMQLLMDHLNDAEKPRGRKRSSVQDESPETTEVTE
jgi:hypothetical protein